MARCAPPSSRRSRSIERAREWRRTATRRTCCTTPSTTGPASTPRIPRWRRWASPGTRRTRSARSCSSSRRPWARPSKKDAPYAEVESVKAVSDVVAPLSGEIVEVNEALAENPQAINEDPYGEGWLVKVRLTDPSERDALMDAASYKASLAARLTAGT